jgi:4-hydroxythreonine-4-phosphate dehydrogenase
MPDNQNFSSRPRLALAIGDPAGIGPELAAHLLADSEVTDAAQIIAIGDSRVLAEGARVAGVRIDVKPCSLDDPLPDDSAKAVFVDMAHLDPKTIPVGEISHAGGTFALENFKMALALGMTGEVGAVTFTPFNKAAMRLAHPAYEDEVVFSAEMLSFNGTASEFNVLPKLWNARVTSHVPISGVAALITEERVLRGLRLTDAAMRAAGFSTPRIAVAALNPHAGDGGNFGTEEIDVLAPVIEEARKTGIVCEGPFPSDTVFVRATRGDFDAVLTMYHDQGQIAMKLIGFDQGVTLLGGMPFPILTPAHGSAYDIAGKGVADPGASRHALLLAARMSPVAKPPSGSTFRSIRQMLTRSPVPERSVGAAS